MKFLFSPKICWHLAPLFGLPLEEGDVGVVVAVEPLLGALDELEKLFGARCTLEAGATLVGFDPQKGVATIGVDGHGEALPLEEGEGVDDGEELSDVVGAVDGAEVEYFLACAQIDATIFHRSGISRTSCIDCQGVGFDGGGKGEHGVVTPRGRIFERAAL